MAIYCYVHVPKCGGTTFRRLLEGCFDPGDICPANTDDEFYRFEGDIGRYSVYIGHFSVNIADRLAEEPHFMTFLREPVARTVSLYYDWKRSPVPTGGRAKPGQQVAKELSLLEFARSDETNVQRWVHNAQCYQLGDHVYYRRTPERDREMYERARANLARFAFVGITERFDESLTVFHRKFGFTAPAGFDQQNVGTSREDIVTPAIRVALGARLEYDIKLYQDANAILDAHLQDLEVECP